MLYRFFHLVRSVLVLLALTGAPLKAQDFLGQFMAAQFAVEEYRYDIARGYLEELPDEAFDTPEILELALKVYMGTGDLDQAVDYADRLLPKDNDFILARIVKTTDLFIRNEFDAINASLDENPLNFPLNSLFLGWSTFGEGSVEDSVEIFQKDFEERGSFLLGFANGLIHASNGNLEMALETLGTVRDYPAALQNEVLYLRIGILLNQGKLDEAGEEYDLLRFSEIEPRKTPFLQLKENLTSGSSIDLKISPEEGLSKLLSAIARITTNNNGPSGDSLAMFGLARYLDPEDISLDFAVSRTLLSLDSLELALLPIEGIMPGDPYYQAAVGLRSDIYYEMGDSDKSLMILQEALELHPTSIDLLYLLGELRTNRSEMQEAVDSISEGIELSKGTNRENWDAYFLRGQLYYYMGIWEKAEADWWKSLEISPDNALVQNNLGYTLAERNIKLVEAEELIAAALEAEPDNGYYVDSMGWVLYRQGKLEEALEYLQRSDRIIPNQAEVIDHIAEVYWVMGEEELAKREWERALKTEPEGELGRKIELRLMYGLEEGTKRFEEEE
ncbi:MAG: tetratricopeptide repeat protein [Rhodobacteraceae bacterium]|nr:tetratricopeptide repeat protein [Paracoccaceae bacterium]